MFECIGCPSLEFESKPDLEAHVAAIHFNYLPYECEKCRFAKFPTEYAIRYHWEFEHQITEYCIRYRVSPELISKREEINTYVQNCVDRQATVPSQNTDYDNEALEKKPNLESTITETNGNFPSSISPVLKQLFGNAADLNVNTSLGGSSNTDNIPITKIKKTSSNRKSKNVASDALKQMKRKRTAASIEPTPSSSSTASSSSSAASTEPTPSSPVQNAATVECTECKRVIANQATSVMYHTNSRHLQLPVFTCTPCKRIWTTISRSDLLKHVKNFHNNDMSVIVDKKEEHIIKIKEKCRQLFPNRGSMVSKRKCYDTSATEDATEAE